MGLRYDHLCKATHDSRNGDTWFAQRAQQQFEGAWKGRLATAQQGAERPGRLAEPGLKVAFTEGVKAGYREAR
jgi:hypothetical protein